MWVHIISACTPDNWRYAYANFRVNFVLASSHFMSANTSNYTDVFVL